MYNGTKQSKYHTYCKIVLAICVSLISGIASAQNTGAIDAKDAYINNAIYVSSDVVNVSTMDVNGFAGNGSRVTGLTPGNISAGALPSNVVASSIAVQAVGAAQIVDNSVTNLQISTGTFGAISIPAGNVNAGALGASVIASSIAASSVGSEQIINNSITDNDMSNTTYNNVNIPAANVNAGSLGASVIASSIAVGSVGNAQITGIIESVHLDASSVTMQGNTFNGVNQLIQTNGSGQYPALDGSLITNIAVNVSRKISGDNKTLGVGTTFYATVESANVTFSTISVTITGIGRGGSTGTVWTCGDGPNRLSVTTSQGLAVGQTVTANGSATISAGTKIAIWMYSSGETSNTPTATVVCSYQ